MHHPTPAAGGGPLLALSAAAPGRPVPISAPGRLAPAAQAAVVAAMAEVVAAGELIGGRQVAAFEAEFARFIGVGHCVGVGNGSDALELALRALGVRAGDHVATVANAGFYATGAILAIGARPAYVDVDPDNHQMALADLERVLAARPAAVVLTHLYGDARIAPAVAAACARAGVPLIEDCAQATGAEVAGVRAGAFGAVAAFSFYPTKPLGAIGDAGAVVTDDADVAVRARRAANHGWDRRFHVGAPGRNSRLDPVQAAVLRLRLPTVVAAADRRRALRQRYVEALAGTAGRLIGGAGDAGHAAHLAVVEVPDATAVRDRLAAAGVATDIHYPVLDHQQQVWAELGGAPRASLPVTEALVGRILTIPCFEGMTGAEVGTVVAALRAAVASDAAPPVAEPGAPARAPVDARVRSVPLTAVEQLRGRIVAGERPAGLPFVPARFFLVSGVPVGEVRGQHAHRTCSQLLVAAAGSLTVGYTDADGAGEVRLSAGGSALLVPPGVYAEQREFSAGAVLLVLADEPYDADGYLPGASADQG